MHARGVKDPAPTRQADLRRMWNEPAQPVSCRYLPPNWQINLPAHDTSDDDTSDGEAVLYLPEAQLAG